MKDFSCQLKQYIFNKKRIKTKNSNHQLLSGAPSLRLKFYGKWSFFMPRIHPVGSIALFQQCRLSKSNILLVEFQESKPNTRTAGSTWFNFTLFLSILFDKYLVRKIAVGPVRNFRKYLHFFLLEVLTPLPLFVFRSNLIYTQFICQKIAFLF